MLYQVNVKQVAYLGKADSYLIDAADPTKAVAESIERWMVSRGIEFKEGDPVPFDRFVWTIHGAP